MYSLKLRLINNDYRHAAGRKKPRRTMNRFSKNGQWTKRPLCRKIDLYRGCSYIQEQIHTSASVRGRNTGYAGDGIDTARDSRAAWIE